VGTNEFPEKKELIVGGIEAMTGLGLILGPEIGGFLLSTFAFSGCFFVTGGICCCLSVIFCLFFPQVATLGGSFDIDDRDSIDVTSQDPAVDAVTLWQLVSIPRFAMAALANVLCQLQYSSLEPILAPRLSERYGMDAGQIGHFFIIMPIFYIMSSVGALYIPQWVERRMVIIVCTSWACTVAYFLVGPSQIFNLHDSLLTMGIGMALAGIFNPVGVVMALPEMINSAIEVHPHQQCRINMLASGFFTGMIGLGQMSAFFYGPIVEKAVGFPLTLDILSIISLVFGLVYLFVGSGCRSFSETCNNYKTRGVNKDDEYYRDNDNMALVD
jgi:hypothetical protein